MTYKINKRFHIIAFVLSFIFTIIAFPFLLTNIGNMIVACSDLFHIENIILIYAIGSIILVLTMSIMHELIHGAVAILFGGKIIIRFKCMYAYTKEVSGKPFTKLQFIFILLSPLIIITLILLPFNHWVTNLIVIFNIMGSSADTLMFLFVCKNSKNSKIISINDGFQMISNN